MNGRAVTTRTPAGAADRAPHWADGCAPMVGRAGGATPDRPGPERRDRRRLAGHRLRRRDRCRAGDRLRLRAQPAVLPRHGDPGARRRARRAVVGASAAAGHGIRDPGRAGRSGRCRPAGARCEHRHRGLHLDDVHRPRHHRRPRRGAPSAAAGWHPALRRALARAGRAHRAPSAADPALLGSAGRRLPRRPRHRRPGCRRRLRRRPVVCRVHRRRPGQAVLWFVSGSA